MSSSINHTVILPDLLANDDWEKLGSSQGVHLISQGEGTPLVVIPGLEGSGESCLHVVLPVVEQLRGEGISVKLCFVHYTGERHESLIGLSSSIAKVIREGLGETGFLTWSQSFGNLLATDLYLDHPFSIKSMVMVSPFTKLPQFSAWLNVQLLAITPGFLYRWTIKPLSRYIFGPVGDAPNHPFFGALRRATPRDVRRQSKWLIGLDYSARFAKLRVPLRLVLGKRDRLVRIGKEIAFFEKLASQEERQKLHVAPETGHVILSQKCTRSAIEYLKEVLSELLP